MNKNMLVEVYLEGIVHKWRHSLKGYMAKGFALTLRLHALVKKKRDEGVSKLSILRDVIYVRHLTII